MLLHFGKNIAMLASCYEEKFVSEYLILDFGNMDLWSMVALLLSFSNSW